MQSHRSMVIAVAIVALLAFSFSASAESTNVIQNGSFEQEYTLGVSEHWGTFNNGGNASYSYHDDTWERVVYDGEHSQLLELHTKAVGGSQKDRYMGIYQTVDVVPGSRYMFSMYGMVRSTEGTESHSSHNYRVQVGFDHNGGTDHRAVADWWQMDWPEYWRTDPGVMQSYAHGVTPTTDKLTVFVRVWKKFPTVGEEANINLDAVSLLGPKPGSGTKMIAAAAAPAPSPAKPTIPQTGAGDLLPVAGISLGVVAVGLTGRRLLRKER